MYLTEARHTDPNEMLKVVYVSWLQNIGKSSFSEICGFGAVTAFLSFSP